MEKYDELIYYSICECLYDELKANKFTNHNTRFKTFCHMIGINLLNNISLTSEQYDILTKTINKLTIIYGESDGKISQYIITFFEGKMWMKYSNIVITLKTNLPFAMQ